MFEHDHVLTLEPPATADPLCQTHYHHTQHTQGGVEPTPTDPLEGLEGTNAAPPKGHGARAKRPSAYAHWILTGEGSTTREVGD